jgi:hypothetical protein
MKESAELIKKKESAESNTFTVKPSFCNISFETSQELPLNIHPATATW